MRTKFGIPLFAFLTRGFYSTPVMIHREQGLSYIYLFTSKEKATSYRNKLKMDVLIVQIQSWLSLRNFLALPPGLDPQMYRSLSVSLDSSVDGNTDNATILLREKLLEIAESQYQNQKVANHSGTLGKAISDMENHLPAHNP